MSSQPFRYPAPTASSQPPGSGSASAGPGSPLLVPPAAPVDPFLHGPRSARPASEVLHHGDMDALDAYYRQIERAERTLDELRATQHDDAFKEELRAIEEWFKVLSDVERTTALYSLLQYISPAQARFFLAILNSMTRRMELPAFSPMPAAGGAPAPRPRGYPDRLSYDLEHMHVSDLHGPRTASGALGGPRPRSYAGEHNDLLAASPWGAAPHTATFPGPPPGFEAFDGPHSRSGSPAPPRGNKHPGSRPGSPAPIGTGLGGSRAASPMPPSALATGHYFNGNAGGSHTPTRAMSPAMSPMPSPGPLLAVPGYHATLRSPSPTTGTFRTTSAQGHRRTGSYTPFGSRPGSRAEDRTGPNAARWRPTSPAPGAASGPPMSPTTSEKGKPPEHVDWDLLEDVPAWLRSLRLHKYTTIMERMHWTKIVDLTDAQLQELGVSAQGARTKFLKVFAHIKAEDAARKGLASPPPSGASAPAEAPPVAAADPAAAGDGD